MKKLTSVVFFFLLLWEVKGICFENFIKSSFTLNDITYVNLEDGSIWELINIQPRAQTWSEWWHGRQVRIDQAFLWEGECWLPTDAIIVSDEDIESLIFESISNEDRIKIRLCDYVLENQRNGKIAFARQISLDDVVNNFAEYANFQYDLGYSEGYSIGYSSGYDIGYSYGYDVGVQDRNN